MSSYIGNFTMCGLDVLVDFVIGPRQASPAAQWPKIRRSVPGGAAVELTNCNTGSQLQPPTAEETRHTAAEEPSVVKGKELRFFLGHLQLNFYDRRWLPPRGPIDPAILVRPPQQPSRLTRGYIASHAALSPSGRAGSPQIKCLGPGPTGIGGSPAERAEQHPVARVETPVQSVVHLNTDCQGQDALTEYAVGSFCLPTGSQWGGASRALPPAVGSCLSRTAVRPQSNPRPRSVFVSRA